MKKKYLLGMTILISILTFNILASFTSQRSASALQTVNLTGRVSGPDVSGVSNVTIVALYPGTGTVMAGPVTTNANGDYTLPVEPGTYDISFDPGFTSLLAPTKEYSYTISTNQILNKLLATKISTMSGTVTDNDNMPITGINVSLTKRLASGQSSVKSAVTDANGYYSISVDAGTPYFLAMNGSNVRGMQSFSYSQSHTGSGIDMSTSRTGNLKLLTTKMTVSAYNNAGNIVSKDITARTSGGTTALYLGDPGGTLSVTSYGYSKYSYSYSGEIPTIVGATYTANGIDTTQTSGSICFNVSQSGTFKYDCLTSPLVVNGATNVHVPSAPPVNKTLSGVVTDGSGAPMPNIVVKLNKYSDSSTMATTNSGGEFTIAAEPNTYYLTLSGNQTHGMISFTLSQSSATHTIDLRTNSVTQNLQVPTTNLTATAYDYTTGALYYNTSVNAMTNLGTAYLYAGDPGHAISVKSTGFTTSSNATGTIGTIAGASYLAKGVNTTQYTDSICVRRNPTSYYDCLTSPYTVAGPASINVPY